jgi:hypothetical protein
MFCSAAASCGPSARGAAAVTGRYRISGDGHRKQLLLPYPWEPDQLEAIRDGVVAVYEAFRHGVPLELAIAELGAAKAPAPGWMVLPPSPLMVPVGPQRRMR